MQTKKKIRHYASRGELSFPWLVFLSPIRLRATREVLLLITWHTVRPNKLKRPSLEQRKVYCRAKQGERLARAQKNPNSPMVFCGDVHIGKIWGKGCRACDFRLIGWWWGNRAVLQESCAQPEVTILHLGGGLSSTEELKDIVMGNSLAIQWLRLGTFTVVAWIQSLVGDSTSHVARPKRKKEKKIVYVYPLRRNQDPAPLFLQCSSFVSASPPFSD